MYSFVETNFSRSAVLGRLIKNKLLAIPTFGFYRFWGKTHLRRLLWQSIKVEGERLTYHGTAGELFIGFLIAMAVLAGLSFVFQLLIGVFALSSGAEPNPIVLVGSQVIYFIGFFALIAFARYRLWRYRLSRTSLSTIRFYQLGSAFKYAGLNLLWGAITILSVGLAYPKMRQALINYQLNQVHYGAENFEFFGGAKALYKIYWPWMLASFVSFVFMSITFGLTEGQIGEIDPNSTVFIFQILTFLSIAAAAVLFMISRVVEFKYIAAHTKFAGAAFACALTTGEIVKLMLKRGIIVALIAAAPVLIIPTMLEASMGSEPMGIYAVFAIMAIAFIYFLLFDILLFMMLFLPVFERLATTLRVDSEGVFKATALSSENSPKYGEGFADALDVGAF